MSALISMPMHHHLRLPVAEVLQNIVRYDDLIGMRFDFRQRPSRSKNQAYFADSSGVSVNGLSPGSPPSLFLLFCAERALRHVSIDSVTGVAICNEEQPTLWRLAVVGKNVRLLWKKASEVRFAFCL